MPELTCAETGDSFLKVSVFHNMCVFIKGGAQRVANEFAPEHFIKQVHFVSIFRGVCESAVLTYQHPTAVDRVIYFHWLRPFS